MSKMIICKRCANPYSNVLKVCPKCFNKTPVPTERIVLGVFLIIIGVATIAVSALRLLNDDVAIGSSSVGESISQSAGVTYANFEKIETGMTYEQVVEIFGEEGKVLSDVDLGVGEEYKTTMYYWYDKTGIANCNVTFQGGVVAAKAQIGLK